MGEILVWDFRVCPCSASILDCIMTFELAVWKEELLGLVDDSLRGRRGGGLRRRQKRGPAEDNQSKDH